MSDVQSKEVRGINAAFEHDEHMSLAELRHHLMIVHGVESHATALTTAHASHSTAHQPEEPQT